MRIHHHARLMVNIPTDDIRRLAPYPCQRGQIFQTARDLPAKPLDESLHACDNIFCFGMVKAGGFNILLQFLQICIGKLLHRVILLK